MTETQRKKLTFNLARVNQTTVSRIDIDRIEERADGQKEVYYKARGFRHGAELGADGVTVGKRWRVV